VKETMHLTKTQWQLLSAYLDGEVSEEERAQVDTLLASHSQAAEALQALRNTKSLLRMLPQRPVPHNFILTRQEAMVARPGWLVKGLRVLSGVSAAALTALLALDLFLPMRAAPQAEMLESMAAEEAPLESAAAPLAQEAPEVESMAAPDEEVPIEPFYFEPAPIARGMGGGGGSPSDEPGGIPGIILPDISINVGGTYSGDSAADQTNEEELTADAEIAAPKDSMNTGPILGVAPPENRGDIIEKNIPRVLPHQTSTVEVRWPSYLLIEVMLLAISLVSALVAIILHRRRRAAR